MDESQHNYAELKKPGKKIDILLLNLYEIPEKKSVVIERGSVFT